VKFSNFIDIWLPADELLLKLDVNPTEKLIKIAESDDASIGQRILCWQEIAKYTYPQRVAQMSWQCISKPPSTDQAEF